MLNAFKQCKWEYVAVFLLAIALFLASPLILFAAAPTISTLSPSDGENNADKDTNLVITFSESVTATTTGNGIVTIFKSSDDSTFEAIDVSSAQVTGSGSVTITINPSSDLDSSTSYYVQIDSDAFFNGTDEYFAGISDTTTWNFHTTGGGGGQSVTMPPAPTISVYLNGSSATVSGSYSGSNIVTEKVGFTYEHDGDVEDVSSSGGPSGFKYVVRDLECGADYIFTGYAKNSVGTAYSDEVEIRTDDCSATDEDSGSESSEEEKEDASVTTTDIEALQAQLAQLRAQLQALQGSGAAAVACEFIRDLTIGSSGNDVSCLQNYLTSTGHFTFSGGATGYFGPVTQSAVAAWQAAHGVSPSAGYFGPISLEKYLDLVE